MGSSREVWGVFFSFFNKWAAVGGDGMEMWGVDSAMSSIHESNCLANRKQSKICVSLPRII